MEEPKIDADIDPPENPILPENPKESINGTVPTYKTTTKTFEPTIKPTINKPNIETATFTKKQITNADKLNSHLEDCQETD